MTAHANAAEQLIEMLQRQRGLIVRLGELARRQSGLIDAGRSVALLDVLTQRQQIIDQFVASQEDLTRLSELVRTSSEEAVQMRRAQIRALTDDIAAGLSEVMQLDSTDQQRLEACRHKTRDELAGITTTPWVFLHLERCVLEETGRRRGYRS